jgi:SOS-response transcriptional repressor LexA
LGFSITTSIYQLQVDITHQLTIAQPLWHSQLMVDKNELRAAFSARLHEALNDAGVRARGRGVDVHNRLKNVGVHKTTQAISKWLNGEAIAEADSMTALCSWLKVRREWLEYGVLPKLETVASTEPSRVVSDHSNSSTNYNHDDRVPLILWGQVLAWCESSGFDKSEAYNWISCPVRISKKGFALTVQGDSMVNTGYGRNYPPGCIIFVDPAATPVTGDRVIAKVPHTDEVTFKVLVEDAGRRFLRPINPQYPIIDITEDTHIYGRIVGAFITD